MDPSRYDISLFREAVLHSYSMVFFNLNRWFALLVLSLTFLDPVAGMAGLFSVLLANGLAILLQFNPSLLKNGDLGFNALLVGLGLGAFYEFNIPLLLLLALAALLTLFVTIVTMGFLSRYELPFLSLPFVFSLWTLMLASRNFEALGVSQRGVYLLNELYAVGDNLLVELYHTLNEWPIPLMVKTYFRSLGAILFQYNMLTGMLLGIALLMYSRIAFTLSVIGFMTAYLFYQFIGADLTQLNYNYIGFNFILSAIAVGGIFLVASGWSYFWAILLIPLLSILTGSLANLLANLQLGLYALPFNVVVLSFLYVLKWRTVRQRPDEVAFQTFHPEHNRYNFLSRRASFQHYRAITVALPVMGEWFVSQGHEGAITHRGDWRHAWDFILLDADGRAYKGSGAAVTDYYAYGKPVVAAAAGTVTTLVDQVPDNAVGETNLEQNWGNSLVIDHGYGLYSQISHIQPGSFQVQEGDYVKRGQILARCGNSGRSPEPHVHFQLQATPFTGAPTLEYPLAMYVGRRKDGVRNFFFYDYPEAHTYVQNVPAKEPIRNAFYMAPGKQFHFTTGDGEEISWECRTDSRNHSYLACLHTGAQAYYRQHQQALYFTDYQGDRRSMLYHFFLAHYQVVFGYIDHLQLSDHYPLHLVARGPRRWLQDLLTPFTQFLIVEFRLQYPGDSENNDIRLRSSVRRKWFSHTDELYRYQTTIQDHHIDRFEIQDGSKKTVLKWNTTDIKQAAWSAS